MGHHYFSRLQFPLHFHFNMLEGATLILLQNCSNNINGVMLGPLYDKHGRFLSTNQLCKSYTIGKISFFIQNNVLFGKICLCISINSLKACPIHPVCNIKPTIKECKKSENVSRAGHTRLSAKNLTAGLVICLSLQRNKLIGCLETTFDFTTQP